tara:strand:+ start:1126 stop:1620 length:495 start_codon:yes stop_codon:yes gene_type:complete
MAYQKLQAGGALAVIPSDHINIPSPSDFIAANSGAITGTDPNYRILAGTTLLSYDLKPGDIIYHDTGPVALRVVRIDSATTLHVDNGAGTAPANALIGSYKIYRNRNQACVLYVGTTGNLTLKMAGDTGRNSVLIKSAAVGYHPLQVIRVAATGTTADDIVALW